MRWRGANRSAEQKQVARRAIGGSSDHIGHSRSVGCWGMLVPCPTLPPKLPARIAHLPFPAIAERSLWLSAARALAPRWPTQAA